MSQNRPFLSKWLAILASASILGVLLAGLYTAFWPVDVLKNWTITVPNASYQAGDTITLRSQYTKVSGVSGKAFRYLECHQNSVWVRYALQSAEANRPPSRATQATGLVLELPSDLPNLPMTCRVTISIDYEIYSFRKFNEYNASNTFDLQPRQ